MNSTYYSPRSQNDINNVIGRDTILANIEAEVNNLKLYSVLADEVSFHNVSNYLFAFDLWTAKATFEKNP